MIDGFQYLKLKPIVGHSSWPVYEELLTCMRDVAREKLETCSVSDLSGIQHEIKILNDLLTLHDDVARINNCNETKSQS